MKDSNQFHAVCLDTYPPIFYLNDVSKSIISLVTAYNQEFSNSADVAYTFDAGPNAVLFMRKSSCDLFFQILNYFFPPPEEDQDIYYGSSSRFLELKAIGAEKMIEVLLKRIPRHHSGLLKRIINTRVGGGPQVLAHQYDPNVSLTPPN